MRLLCKLFLFVTISLFSFGKSISQIDSTNIGWKIGINAGVYVSSNYHAGFYSGHDNNKNSINFILGNRYHFQEIMHLLNATDSFRLHGLPEQMKYSPAVMVGFSFRNNFKEDMAWFIQFNQVRLRSVGLFTLEVDPKDNILTFPDLRTYNIYGEEQRFTFELGISREFEIRSPMFRPFIDAGITFTNTKVRANKINIEEREFSLINVYGNQTYVPNSNMQTFLVEQGGLGYGGFFSFGTKFYVNNFFSLDPSLTLFFNTTNLEPYNLARPNFFFNIRMSVNNIFLYQERHNQNML